MFKFHQVQIARHDIQTRKMRGPDDRRQRHRIIIADRIKQSATIQQIEFRLKPMQGGQTGLRIKVDGQHAVSIQGHLLRQMRRGGGFARATFEVDHRYDLQMIIANTSRQIGAGLLGSGL